jgi:DNA-damage-inducible protein D
MEKLLVHRSMQSVDLYRFLGAVLPENISPAEPIKKVEKRLKTAKPQILLDSKEAIGLLPGRERGEIN